MNKTKIDWTDYSWNPISGCKHGCPYCYARREVARFAAGQPTGETHVVESKKCGEGPYPYGFDPTFYRYKLNEAQRKTRGASVFVGSMSDIFGEWVPLCWIRDIFDACLAGPQHRYLFLTKNPNRYMQLEQLALLPHGDNFWYGSSVTTAQAESFYCDHPGVHTFASVEPILEPVHLPDDPGKCPEWVIIGAETGNRAGKVIPEKRWVEDLVRECADKNIPMFMKESLRGIMGEEFIQQLPWESEAGK